ncbi:cytochrome P450 family 71 subfamily B polypeptide 4 [Euphorbia peplus]|nr:putative cytochrome P450 monooxygenase [Euphorbia peplus]WCJ37105.1 cytochrome P450 family 71 subfamily B polypeptide 4 [Euphorbia peplus]
MEIQIIASNFSIILSFFLFIFMALKIWKRHSQNAVVPPGPFKFPIIGNLPQLFGAELHHRLTDLGKIYGPVMSIQQGQIPAIVISSAELVKEVLKNQSDVFAGRPIMQAQQITLYNGLDIAFAPYGDHWRQMRKISALEFLSAKRVQSFRALREEQVSKVMKLLHSKAGSPVSLTKTIIDLTNSFMLLSTFGENGNTKQDLLNILDRVKEATSISVYADFFPSIKFIQYLTSGAMARLRKWHLEADRILEDIIDEHKAKKQNDDGKIDNLLDVLLDIQKKGDLQIPLSDDCLKANIVEIFGAGSDTTSRFVEWLMAELMRNPKAMRKLQEEVRRVFGEKGQVEESRLQDLKYMKLVVKETFRLHPLGAVFARQCRERTKVDGFDVYPNTTVIINVHAIGRDPNLWTEPERFCPERFEDSEIDYKGAHMELIPFGAGKRICPGISFSIVFVELLLANFVYHFDWKLPDEITSETLDMTEVFRVALSKKEELHLIPIPFSPLPKIN